MNAPLHGFAQEAGKKERAMEYGIVLAGHGSRDQAGVREFEMLAKLVKQRAGGHFVTHGFLEFARPTIDEAARETIAAGSRLIVIVPGILLAAAHGKNDLPHEVQMLRREFPEREFHFASAVGLHPAMLEICRERIIESETKSPQLVRRAETCLVVVGRGTSDSDANSEVSKLARMLEEGMGFGGSFVCYSGTAHPLVRDGLEMASRLSFRRYIILPFFLFTGILINRIYAAVDEMQSRAPGSSEWLKCGYLGLHERVADLFLERAAEAIAGRAAMNCSLCKYRVQIVGYEREVGAAQVGHHFHARTTQDMKRDAASAPMLSAENKLLRYEPHPIERQSFEIIESLRDWSLFDPLQRAVLQRLVHTTGEVGTVDDIFVSKNALESGLNALKNHARIVTDVTMVQSGLRRSLLEQLGIETWCGVHDSETYLLAQNANLTRSAAGIRRAWELFGNHIVLVIGDAPTAVEEALWLIREAKENLRRCLRVPRVTNSGTRGGSPWAASVMNALLICAANQTTCRSERGEESRVISGHATPSKTETPGDFSLRSE
jgi:precorrin-8X/cobalt-precorrin-8 methylmutase